MCGGEGGYACQEFIILKMGWGGDVSSIIRSRVIKTHHVLEGRQDTSDVCMASDIARHLCLF